MSTRNMLISFFLRNYSSNETAIGQPWTFQRQLQPSFLSRTLSLRICAVSRYETRWKRCLVSCSERCTSLLTTHRLQPIVSMGMLQRSCPDKFSAEDLLSPQTGRIVELKTNLRDAFSDFHGSLSAQQLIVAHDQSEYICLFGAV